MAQADPIPDLNSVITSAVQARIEADVLASLSNDETFAKFVQNALQQPVEVPKAGSSYDKVRVPFLRAVIDKAIQEATVVAVQNVINQERPKIETAVAAEIRKKVKVLAAGLVDSMEASSKSSFSMKVEISPRTSY